MAETLAGVVAPLARDLARRIAAQGPISVAAFMDEALFHPQWGYYATRDPLGARGDFVTAPEISQVFGELIGLWCAELWQRMGKPGRILLVELGPGRGTLMADALRAARIVPGFIAAVELHMVERSPVLRVAQARALESFAPSFHDDLGDVPQAPMLLVANEFLDALPIRQFQRGADGWHERLVGLDAEERLRFVSDPAAAREALPEAPPGAVAELRPAARGVAGDVAARLVASGGAALFIDYGYFPRGLGDTFQAVRGHKTHDPLDAPGTADLTAHVDFQDFAEAGSASGARVHGPVAQGEFLRALGIEARAEALMKSATPVAATQVRSGCRRLIDPRAMGALFKAMALAAPDCPTPAGFAP